MAHIGQTGMRGLLAYSPWFNRVSEAVTFLYEVIDIGGGGTLAIDVEHKNLADTAGSVAGSFTTLTSAGIGSLALTSMKEQLRFKYVFGGTADTDWVHYRMLQPVWRS